MAVGSHDDAVAAPLRKLTEAHDHANKHAGHSEGEDFVTAMHAEDVPQLVQELHHESESDVDIMGWLLTSLGCALQWV